MEIEQFRVTLKARVYERTCQFYAQTLALPKLGSWEREDLQGSEFQVGPGVLEVLGRVEGAPRREDDEAFEYRGPDEKLVLTLGVPSPQKAYDEIIFRQKNVPGGMHELEDGSTVFQTRDPDGTKIVFRQTGE
jgi:catechol 2,3-dioxygenase-like lactoylglutathione lyase family enzyme